MYKDLHEMLPSACRDIVLQVHTLTGATPHHPSIYNIKAVPHMEVKVLSKG
jgi:hypothetical protein